MICLTCAHYIHRVLLESGYRTERQSCELDGFVDVGHVSECNCWLPVPAELVEGVSRETSPAVLEEKPESWIQKRHREAPMTPEQKREYARNYQKARRGWKTPLEKN